MCEINRTKICLRTERLENIKRCTPWALFSQQHDALVPCHRVPCHPLGSSALCTARSLLHHLVRVPCTVFPPASTHVPSTPDINIQQPQRATHGGPGIRWPHGRDVDFFIGFKPGQHSIDLFLFGENRPPQSIKSRSMGKQEHSKQQR